MRAENYRYRLQFAQQKKHFCYDGMLKQSVKCYSVLNIGGDMIVCAR